MTQKKLFFLLFLAIFTFLFFIFLLTYPLFKGKRPIGETPPPTPTSFPQARVRFLDLEVNNFFQMGEEINKNGDRALQDTKKYQIVYLAPFQEFIIDITTSPFNENRKIAEEDFIKLLGVTKDTACKLNVSISGSPEINPEDPGRRYGLSFCESKQ